MSAYKIMQDGTEVARVDAKDDRRAWTDAMHYAMVYSMDCDVQVYAKVGKKWQLSATMEHRKPV